MKLYHILTESHKSWMVDYLPAIEEIVSKRFEGFTLTRATGYYKGIKEPSVIIEIATDDLKEIIETIKEICKRNEQECCLLVCGSEAVLIDRNGEWE